MQVAGWKAWYTQHRVYRSAIDRWEDLPKEGVLFVMVFFDEFASNGERYREALSGNRRYIMATGSSGEIFLKTSLWKEEKLLNTYDTKSEWIKEGIWDDETTVKQVHDEAFATITWK